jgi:hypothetical protein
MSGLISLVACFLVAPGAGHPRETSDIVADLKHYADTLETYYLDWVLHNRPLRLPRNESHTRDVAIFRELMKRLDALTPDDIDACVKLLSRASEEGADGSIDKPSPQHTALLLTALFHTMKRCHLPLIARYMNDDRIVHDYPRGSPEARRFIGFRPGGRERVRVQDIARHFLRMWGFRAVHVSLPQLDGGPVLQLDDLIAYIDPKDFEAFWRPEQNVPGPATALWLRALRATDGWRYDWTRLQELECELQTQPRLEQLVFSLARVTRIYAPPPEVNWDRPQIVDLIGHFPKELAISVLQGNPAEPVLPGHGDLVGLFPHEAEAVEARLVYETVRRIWTSDPNAQIRSSLAFRVLSFDGQGALGSSYPPLFSGLHRSFYLNVLHNVIRYRSQLFTEEEFAAIMEEANAPARQIWTRSQARATTEK